MKFLDGPASALLQSIGISLYVQKPFCTRVYLIACFITKERIA